MKEDLRQKRQRSHFPQKKTEVSQCFLRKETQTRYVGVEWNCFTTPLRVLQQGRQLSSTQLYVESHRRNLTGSYWNEAKLGLSPKSKTKLGEMGQVVNAPRVLFSWSATVSLPCPEPHNHLCLPPGTCARAGLEARGPNRWAEFN